MNFAELFAPFNGPGFKYYPHFLVLYSLLIVAAIALKFLRRKMDKNQRLQKKVARNSSNILAWIGAWGFFFLFCRYAYVAYLSAEIFHVLLVLSLIAAVIYYGWRLKAGYPKKKKKVS